MRLIPVHNWLSICPVDAISSSTLKTHCNNRTCQRSLILKKQNFDKFETKNFFLLLQNIQKVYNSNQFDETLLFDEKNEKKNLHLKKICT